MNDRMRKLLEQMNALENEISVLLHEQQVPMFFQIRGKRVEFERSIREAHQKLKKSFFHWLVTNRPQNLVTGPVIYAMAVPLVLLDICVSFYQATCFPIYRIAAVRRGDFIVFDRQHLEYLNLVEKFHCTYCAYATGLVAYITEIIARTEQYFCPIKHARRMVGTHARYAHFLEYGDGQNYEARLEELRLALRKDRTP